MPGPYPDRPGMPGPYPDRPGMPGPYPDRCKGEALPRPAARKETARSRH